MTDAGEKLRERVRRQIEFRAKVPMSAMQDVEVIVRTELEWAAVKAETTTTDEFSGRLIAAAIRKLKE